MNQTITLPHRMHNSPSNSTKRMMGLTLKRYKDLNEDRRNQHDLLDDNIGKNRKR